MNWPCDDLEQPEGDDFSTTSPTVYRVESPALLHFVCIGCVVKYDEEDTVRFNEGSPIQFNRFACDDCGMEF